MKQQIQDTAEKNPKYQSLKRMCKKLNMPQPEISFTKEQKPSFDDRHSLFKCEVALQGKMYG